jgi:UDP-N-acetylmuramoyl-L-alanyl-D-glutamate--2,6-diaminopimelate ligase
MGRAAGAGSDFVVLTSDNPRGEDPDAIIAGALAGLRETGTPHEVCADRERAIGLALDNAPPGDVVVLAGKGHEDYQEVGARRIPFQDAEVARRLLAKRGASRGQRGGGGGATGGAARRGAGD